MMAPEETWCLLGDVLVSAKGAWEERTTNTIIIHTKYFAVSSWLKAPS